METAEEIMARNFKEKQEALKKKNAAPQKTEAELKAEKEAADLAEKNKNTPPAKTQAELDAEKAAAELAEKNKNIDLSSMTDEQFNEIAAKRGLKVVKPEPTDTEKEAAKQERKSSIYKFATENKLTTHDEWVNFEKIKETPAETLTYNKFAADFKKKNPNAAAEDIKAKFDLAYNQNEDADPELKEIGASRIKEEGEAVKNGELSKLTSIENKFEGFQKTQESLKSYIDTVKPLIKDELKDEFSLDVEIEVNGKKETLPISNVKIFDKDEDFRKQAEDFFLNESVANNLIKTGAFTDKAQLKDNFNKFFIAANYKKIAQALIEIGISKGIAIGKIGGTGTIEKDGHIEGGEAAKESEAVKRARKGTYAENE